jgi:hypothetical protein
LDLAQLSMDRFECATEIPAGVATVFLYDSLIESRRTGQRRTVPTACFHAAVFQPSEQESERQVSMPPHAFLRVRVHQAVDNRTGQSGRGVGVALPGVTLEAPLDADGTVTFLVPPGESFIYIASTAGEPTWARVDEGTEDAGEVTLTIGP